MYSLYLCAAIGLLIGLWFALSHDLSRPASHWIFHPDADLIVKQDFRVPTGSVRQITT
ncbi:MAG: hypothetical protein KGS72_19390 [Cyanobacteria bacterium REEB67]|nr:hypothetical protein [Cyanobacteria bacterium REEB67]